MLRDGDGETSAGEEDGRLDRGVECNDCERRWYYDRHRCPDCGGTDHRPVDLGRGELVARTVARVTPPDVREENPLGLARFDGVGVAAQLPPDEESRPEVGDAVELRGSFPLRRGPDGRVTGPRLVSPDGESNRAGDGESVAGGGVRAGPAGGSGEERPTE